MFIQLFIQFQLFLTVVQVLSLTLTLTLIECIQRKKVKQNKYFLIIFSLQNENRIFRSTAFDLN